MEHLMRNLAPITSETWRVIEEEASETLRSRLVARQLFDVGEPLGWEVSSIDCGRTTAVDVEVVDNVELSLRTVQPLVELKVPFEVPRKELDALARGASDARLPDVVAAATKIAQAEDKLIFDGLEQASVTGALPGTVGKVKVAPADIPRLGCRGDN